MRTNIKRIRKVLVAEEEVTRFLNWVRHKDRQIGLTKHNWEKVLNVVRANGRVAGRAYLALIQSQKVRKVVGE